MTATALTPAHVGSHAGLGGTVKLLPLTVSFNTDALVDESEVVAGKLPGHILVVGGRLVADDLDTGSKALELDWGWAANGADQNDGYTDIYGNVYTNAGYQASQTGFVDSGALGGDAVTDIMAAGKNYRPVLLSKPLYFKTETSVIMHIEAIAATQAAGNATLYLEYIIP